MGLDLIVALGGLILPPAVDFIKKKFLKSEQDTPERTISSLATTKPEVLPQFVQGLAAMKETAIKFFNRDVIGTPSTWVIDLRAAIRPLGVIFCLAALGLDGLGAFHLAEGARLTFEAIASSWFGDRIRLR